MRVDKKATAAARKRHEQGTAALSDLFRVTPEIARAIVAKKKADGFPGRGARRAAGKRRRRAVARQRALARR